MFAHIIVGDRSRSPRNLLRATIHSLLHEAHLDPVKNKSNANVGTNHTIIFFLIIRNKIALCIINER